MWTRRTLLRVTGLAAGAALVPASPAWAEDEYDTLRARWLSMIMGGSYDPAAEPFKTKLTWLAEDADRLRPMSPSGNPIWADLPLGTISANLNTTVARLATLARAYLTAGSGYTNDAALLTDLLNATDNIIANHYTVTGGTYDNWYNWRIGIPRDLQRAMVLLHDHLGASRIADCNAAIDHHVPDSVVSSYSGTSTGANRVDLCRVLAMRGVLGKTSTKIALARDALSPVFPLVSTGDGFYADGSFIQHTSIPYAGAYGTTLLEGLAKLLALLTGSSWEVTDPDRQLVFDSVEKSFAPFLFNGLMMDGVSGRAISRGLGATEIHGLQNDDHRRGHRTIARVLQLAEAAAPTEAARWRGLAKGWLMRDYWSPPMQDLYQSIPTLASLKELLDDASVTPIAEPVDSRVFGSMDRATHRRPSWTMSLSLCSSRISYYETGNTENLHGWHTGNGMTFWWGSTSGNGQYSDAFWPTVDPYRLPGITVSRKALADAAGGDWGAATPATTFAGGATDGSFSVLGQDTRGLSSTLIAKKSWFCLDDSIVCLGAGITANDGTAVETTVDNRNLGGGSGTHTFTVDGVAQPTNIGWNGTFASAGWAHIGGFGGYIFPNGTALKALRENREHSWSEINGRSSTDLIGRKYLTLWFDHGTDPTNAQYSYLLLPGASTTDTAARAANPTVSILANSDQSQAISDSATGVTAANFFVAGTIGPITVSAPCSVLMRETGGTLSVSVADPSQEASTVTVTLNRNGFTTASGDDRISIVDLNPITLVVEVGGSHGSSRTLTFGTGAAATAGREHQLSPVADAYVRDGNHASTNFGNDNILAVKSDAPGYARRSLLKFNLSSLDSAPRRAVLWLYGRTADSQGTQVTITGHSVSDNGWTETGVTWNNQPVLGAALDSAMLGDRDDWLPLDVTAHVQARYAANSVATVCLAQAAEKGYMTKLNSREHSTHPAFLQVITE